MPVARLGHESGDSAMALRVRVRNLPQAATVRATCVNTLDTQRTRIPAQTDTAEVRQLCMDPESVLAGRKGCLLRDQSVRPLLIVLPRP